MSIKKRIVASLENLENPLVEIPEAKMSNDDLVRSSEEDATAMAELSEEIQSLEDNEETLINLNDDIAQQAVNIQAMDGETSPQAEGDTPVVEGSEQPVEGEEGSEAPVEGEPAPTLDKDSSDEDVGEAVMEENASLEAYSDRLSGEKRKVLVKSFGFESIGYKDILRNPRDAYKETHRQFLALRDASMEEMRTSEGNVMSKLLDWVSGDDALWNKYSPGAKEIKEGLSRVKDVKLPEPNEVSMRVTILASTLPVVCAKNFNKFYAMKFSKGNLDRFPSLPSNVKASSGTDLKHLYPLGIEELNSRICKVLVIDDRVNSEGKNDVTTIVLDLVKPDEIKNGSEAYKLADSVYKNMVVARDLVDPTVGGIINGVKRYGSMGVFEMLVKSFLGGIGLSHEIMQRLDNTMGNNLVTKFVNFIPYEVVGKPLASFLGFAGGLGAILNTPVVLGLGLVTYMTRGRHFSRASKDNMIYYHYFHALRELGAHFEIRDGDWGVKKLKKYF